MVHPYLLSIRCSSYGPSVVPCRPVGLRLVRRIRYGGARAGTKSPGVGRIGPATGRIAAVCRSCPHGGQGVGAGPCGRDVVSAGGCRACAPAPDLARAVLGQPGWVPVTGGRVGVWAFRGLRNFRRFLMAHRVLSPARSCLVGSEMCIRDRDWGFSRALRWRKRIPP